MQTKHLVAMLLLCLSGPLFAQKIIGTVVDKKKEPVMNASIMLKLDSGIKRGTVTDFDGNYELKVQPGSYTLTATSAGYLTKTITNIQVDSGQTVPVNITLENNSNKLQEIIVKYRKPLIKSNGRSVLTAAEIKCKPTTQTSDLVSASYGVYQNNNAIRPVNLYTIPGTQVQGAVGVDMAQGATEQLYINGNTVSRNPGAESYNHYAENDFKMVVASPLSTMSADVDRASYTNIRRYINGNTLPPPDAVRIEEMINYFPYRYAEPTGDHPVAIHTELTTCPWKAEHQLLRIGIQAKRIDATALPPSNLVFLIDVSGSMSSDDKLPLLKESLRLLVMKLRSKDKIAMVVYAGSAGLVLQATSGTKKEVILMAIDRLEAGGSTAGAEGIELAYKVAEQNFMEGGNNRVILATDGDFNVGISNNNDLEALIERKRKTGIFLSCLGFGMGNYKDDKMELLADKGNGNYNYIDNLEEARKTLVYEFGGTLFTVAKDVKAQIEFNPAAVQAYRLIGYDNRLLNTEDFKDDRKDAGDMGEGHTVTILYELAPTGKTNGEQRAVDTYKYQQLKLSEPTGAELATVKIRYKQPDACNSRELNSTIAATTTDYNKATEDTRFAASAALAGMLLKGSAYAGKGTYKLAIEMAGASSSYDPDGYRSEFSELLRKAGKLPAVSAR